MQQKSTSRIILFIILLIPGIYGRNSSFGQSAEKCPGIKEIIDQANQIYGPDDFIERGLIYIPQYPKAKGHPYLTENNWNPATIILLGKQYTGYSIKYDVSHDQLILKKPIEGSDVHQPILLQDDLIDEFSFAGYNFSNMSRIDSSGTISGFAQIIFNGDFIFYQTFNKKFINQYTASNPNGFYSKLNSEYFLFQDGNVVKINGEKSLLAYFKPIQKPLKKHFRKERFRFNKAGFSEFNQIMTFCEQQLSNISD